MSSIVEKSLVYSWNFNFCIYASMNMSQFNISIGEIRTTTLYFRILARGIYLILINFVYMEKRDCSIPNITSPIDKVITFYMIPEFRLFFKYTLH